MNPSAARSRITLSLAALLIASFAGLGLRAAAQDIAPEVEETRKALLADARSHEGRANGIKVQGRKLFERDFQEIAACEARAARMKRAAELVARSRQGQALSEEEAAALAAALAELKRPLRLEPLVPKKPLLSPPPKPAEAKLAALDAEIAALAPKAEGARLEAERLALKLEMLKVERALLEARRALKALKGGE